MSLLVLVLSSLLLLGTFTLSGVNKILPCEIFASDSRQFCVIRFMMVIIFGSFTDGSSG